MAEYYADGWQNTVETDGRFAERWHGFVKNKSKILCKNMSEYCEKDVRILCRRMAEYCTKGWQNIVVKDGIIP
jgi:hypothetical protein